MNFISRDSVLVSAAHNEFHFYRRVAYGDLLGDGVLYNIENRYIALVELNQSGPVYNQPDRSMLEGSPVAEAAAAVGA